MIGMSNFLVPDAVTPSVTALPSDADVIERLLLEFEATHGLRLVSGVIRGCRAELRDTASGYSSQSLDALVRGRLAGLLPADQSSPVRVGAA